jgi:hypothetical protein
MLWCRDLPEGNQILGSSMMRSVEMPKRISKKEAKKFIRDGLTRRDQIIARLKAVE